MRSKISLFDPSVFRKNVTRFAPAWALYTIGLFMMMFLVLDIEGGGIQFAKELSFLIPVMAFFNFCYAFLCAQLLFGDLFNSRMCNALHAMPLRRETWFVTHAVTGLAFSAVPNFAAMLFSMLFTGSLWLAPLLWFAATMLQFVFFFGTAVFSCFCVGNRFAMSLVYLIINGFSVIVYWLVETMYAPMLYGISIDMDIFVLLCPVVKMIEGPEHFSVASGIGRLQLGSGWIYTGICSLLGLAYAGAGLALYRKRNLESAGDFVATKGLYPVFLLLYTFCGGTVCHGYFSLFYGQDNMGFLILGLAIGFFTGKMLLERTIRIFTGKTFLRFGILLAAFLATVLLTKLDPLGITRWVPQEEQVESVSFYTGSGRYMSSTVTDPEEIEKLLLVHQHGVENREEDINGQPDVRFYVTYTMKNGTVWDRNYTIDVDTQAGQILKELMSKPEAVFATEELDKFLDTVYAMELPDGKTVPSSQWRGLYEAMLQDCIEGNMAQDWNFYRDQQAGWLVITLKDTSTGVRYSNIDIRINEDCRNTMQWLEDHGYTFEKFG